MKNIYACMMYGYMYVCMYNVVCVYVCMMYVCMTNSYPFWDTKTLYKLFTVFFTGVFLYPSHVRIFTGSWVRGHCFCYLYQASGFQGFGKRRQLSS